MQKKTCIQSNNMHCVNFKVNSISLLSVNMFFCLRYIKQSKHNIYVIFSYKRKIQIKENNKVEDTNNVIKSVLESNFKSYVFNVIRLSAILIL